MSQRTEGYSIADDSGAVVLTELNELFAAIATMNSGSTEPTVKYPFMLWGQTGLSSPLIKQRNSANSSWNLFRDILNGPVEDLSALTSYTVPEHCNTFMIGSGAASLTITLPNPVNFPGRILTFIQGTTKTITTDINVLNKFNSSTTTLFESGTKTNQIRTRMIISNGTSWQFFMNSDQDSEPNFSDIPFTSLTSLSSVTLDSSVSVGKIYELSLMNVSSSANSALRIGHTSGTVNLTLLTTTAANNLNGKIIIENFGGIGDGLRVMSFLNNAAAGASQPLTLSPTLVFGTQAASPLTLNLQTGTFDNGQMSLRTFPI